MAFSSRARPGVKLPTEVNRALYVKNLPHRITSEDMYDLFGKYGAIRQIRLGDAPDTRGTAYVIYEDIFDAKNAKERLQGFNVGGRYLIVLYYQQNKASKKTGVDKKQEELNELKKRFNL